MKFAAGASGALSAAGAGSGAAGGTAAGSGGDHAVAGAPGAAGSGAAGSGAMAAAGAAAPVVCPETALPPGDTTTTLQFGGMARTFLLHVPGPARG